MSDTGAAKEKKKREVSQSALKYLSNKNLPSTSAQTDVGEKTNVDWVKFPENT